VKSSQASREIAVNVEKVAQMSEKTSATVNDVVETAKELKQLAEALEVNIRHFHV